MKKTFPKQYFENFLSAKITKTKYIDPGYDNTNDVWFVDTLKNNYVIKLSGHKKTPPTGSFWYGLSYLFGSHPYKEFPHLKKLSQFLSKNGGAPIPKIYHLVINDKVLKQSFIIQERIFGKTYTYKNNKGFFNNPKIMEEFGYHIACLQNKKFHSFGSWDKRVKHEKKNFKRKLKATIKNLYKKFHSKDKQVTKLLPHYLKQVDSLETPKHFTFIMLDNGASQFLTRKNKITGFVDIESYIIGPKEMELAALELDMLKPNSFIKGYKRKQKNFPSIEKEREIYRFFFYLLFNAPPRDLNYWIKLPKKFN